MRPLPGKENQQGVLDRAFTMLDALSRAEHGLGLSELARATGLAKTTALRIVEQLVAIGAVQHIDGRYMIGHVAARIGRSWQPDPFLGDVARDLVRALVGPANAAALYGMYAGQGRLVTAVSRRNHCWMLPTELTSEHPALTAAWYVLQFADYRSRCPNTLPPKQWQGLTQSIYRRGFAISAHQHAIPGISCIAAPLPGDGNGSPAAVVAALTPASSIPPGLTDLVVYAADQIEYRRNRQVTPPCRPSVETLDEGFQVYAPR